MAPYGKYFSRFVNDWADGWGVSAGVMGGV